MHWDAWICGDLSFPSGALEKWKKARVDRTAWAAFPPWLHPTAAADARVSTLLANVKYWVEPLARYVHAADTVAVLTTSSSAAFRAYLTGGWFAHFAGVLAALAVSAAEFQATGEVAFVDVRTATGWLLVLARGRAPVFETIDLTTPSEALRFLAEDARGFLEGTAQVVLPSMHEPHPARGAAELQDAVGGREVQLFAYPDPFRADHLAANAVYDADETFARPLELEGTTAEVERARSSCAVFDLSQSTPIRVSYNDPVDFVRSLAPTWDGRTEGEIDLVDPETGAFADRAHVSLAFEGRAVQLLGSAIDRACLHDWLRARAAERSGARPTIAMPVLFPSPGLVFVGPGSQAVAAEILGAPGQPGLRHGLPATWAWLTGDVAEIGRACRPLFAGVRAENLLDAGAPPRPTWAVAHRPPYATPERREVPVRAAAPVKKGKVKKP